MTNEDYELFDDRNPYLTAKLLTIFTEHPVIFLGYSLGDPNIQNILGAIARCLTTANVNKLRDRLIIVQWDANCTKPMIQNSNMILGEFTIPIIEIRAASFLEIFQVLASMKRKFPAKLLRSLKEHVYDLVLSTELSEKLYVQNIDGDLDKSEIDVVFGVGLFRQLQQIGYKGLTRDDLVNDLLDTKKGKKPVDSKEIVATVLPELVKNAKYVPIFKYLRETGSMDDKGNLLKPLSTDKLNIAAARQKVDFYPAPFYQGKKSLIPCTLDGFRDFIKTKQPKEVLTYIALFDDGCYDLALMKEFLVNHRALQTEPSTTTAYYMMLCLYDLLKYKFQIEEKA